MPKPPVDGMPDEDLRYIEQHRNAFKRQMAARNSASSMSDDERRKAAQEHMRSIKAMAGDAQPSTQPSSTQHPQAVHQANIPRQSLSSISILIAVPEGAGSVRMTAIQAGEKFAPDWPSMKDMISKHDGTWIVSRYEFSPDVSNILGFFKKDGWSFPDNAEKEQFEAIVKNGRVFRTDPE